MLQIPFEDIVQRMPFQEAVSVHEQVTQNELVLFDLNHIDKKDMEKLVKKPSY